MGGTLHQVPFLSGTLFFLLCESSEQGSRSQGRERAPPLPGSSIICIIRWRKDNGPQGPKELTMEEGKQDSQHELFDLVRFLDNKCSITKDAMAEVKATVKALVKAVREGERQQELDLEIVHMEAKE
jgi:predicted oxidoreductase